MTEKIVEIFTDGACSGNPGPGGWGAVMLYADQQKQLYGGCPDTTNNRMELQAAISALQSLTRPCHVILTTDSEYLRRGMTEWVKKWQSNGWRTANKKPVKNSDLWQALIEQDRRHSVSWRWVRGHIGHAQNELADALARRGAAEVAMQAK